MRNHLMMETPLYDFIHDEWETNNSFVSYVPHRPYKTYEPRSLDFLDDLAGFHVVRVTANMYALTESHAGRHGCALVRTTSLCAFIPLDGVHRLIS